MGTVFLRTNAQVGNVGTTRLITIGTDTATQVVAGSGIMGIHVQNNGPTTISWGDSSILISSGGILFPFSQFEWLNVQDGFSQFFRADSAEAVLAWNEYDIP